jgi:hypothetical protein
MNKCSDSFYFDSLKNQEYRKSVKVELTRAYEPKHFTIVISIKNNP